MAVCRLTAKAAAAATKAALTGLSLVAMRNPNAAHDSSDPALACNPKGLSSPLRSVATAVRCTRPCLPYSSFAISHNH